MAKDNDTIAELSQMMTSALLRLRELTSSDLPKQQDFLSIVNTFLLGVISTTANLVELIQPGSAPFIYADIEAGAKLGGLHAIKNMQSANGHMGYSVSNIDPDDRTTAMNYLGQELSVALYKGMHELPLSLREPKMWLRGIEALLANLLHQKFNGSHEILNSLCDHVHVALTYLELRTRH